MIVCDQIGTKVEYYWSGNQLLQVYPLHIYIYIYAFVNCKFRITFNQVDVIHVSRIIV